MTAPAKTASKAAWTTFLTDQGIDVPKDASRADMIDLWNLHQDDTDSVDVSRTDVEEAINYKPGPSAKAATLDVPDDLSFTTDSNDRRDPEKLLIKINGNAHYLYQPSMGLLLLVAANLSSTETSFADRIRTMMDLLNTCLDTAGAQAVRAAMFARDNRFDQDLLGKLTAVIFERWAPEENIDTSSTPQPSNRGQRRQAAR